MFFDTAETRHTPKLIIKEILSSYKCNNILDHSLKIEQGSNKLI